MASVMGRWFLMSMIRYTSVKHLGFDSHYDVVLFLYNDCIVTVPLKTIKLIFAEILAGKEYADLTADLPIVVHYNPSYVNDPSTVQYMTRPQCLARPILQLIRMFHTSHFFKAPLGGVCPPCQRTQFGSRTRPFWTESENGPCYVWPGNPNWVLKKLYSLADMSRGALRGAFSVSSDHRFGAITDDQSRITLVDLHRGVALRFWKGCKEAQTCFVDVSERFPPAGRLPRTAKFMLIYLPRSNSLEVWPLIYGPLLKCWSINGSLRFLLPHMSALRRALKHFNALCVVGNEHLVGIRLSLDLWFPHTPEARDFETFSRLRRWVCSRSFKASLKSGMFWIYINFSSDFSASISKLEGLLGDFTLPDWFLKAVWVLLCTNMIDLTTLVVEKLMTLGDSFPLEATKKHAFLRHLEKICSLIHFYHGLSRMYDAQSQNRCGHYHESRNKLVEPVAQFFPECGKAVELPKFPQSWTFFRAAAYSSLFWIVPDGRFHDKTAAHEMLLGRAIFAAFFWGTISVESFLNLLNDAPFSYDYLLVLAVRWLVAQSTLPPQISPSGITQLTQTLFSNHPHHLSTSFGTIYSVLLASRNYAVCLVVCAALLGAADADKQLSMRKSPKSKKGDEDGPGRSIAPDIPQFSLDVLRHRIQHLQDMVAFNHCLASFRRCYDLPGWISRAYSVRHVFRRSSDHFTSEFSRCLAGSKLKGSEVLEIYRSFAVETAVNEFVDDFRVLCGRLPHTFEVNRVLVCAAWWLVRQLSSPWSRLDQSQRILRLRRVIDFLSVTSNAGHRLAFTVACQCYRQPILPMLRHHFCALESTDLSQCLDDPFLLNEALTFCEFFNQFRRVCIAAMEECPLHRDASWEVSTARQFFNETLHARDEDSLGARDGGNDDGSLTSRSTFPLDHFVDPSLEDAPTFGRLDVWLQFLVLHTAILAFGIPPKTWGDEVQAHPVQLLPASWEENLPFTPPTWTRNIVPLPPPLQAKIALLRRAFIDWLLRSSACQSDQRLDSHSLRSRLCAVTMRLAVVWGLPPGLAHVLHVVALYTAWSDREAEAELISPSSSSSSAFPSAPFSVGNAGANLFHLLAGRICFLNEQLSGRLLASASESLRDMLACLWGDSSGVDSVSREGAPSVAEQVSSARRLVDFLVHHLPRQSNQRAMTMELGELLQTIDKSPQ
ncbi:Rab3 GTPase-activating protein non-catalytic subunit [Taenia crassiceps]|uniref:Rab3 GTPase-activating protein non-catalytic subunit n=1 Tax=Taenia crassiceps TaxID=6207 RepID=A0ABR4QTZ0_9CEST